MGKRNRVWIGILILITPIVLLSAVWIYINQLSNTTEFSVIAFMEELSDHDMQNIQSQLENSWNEIETIYYRMYDSKYNTIQEVCNRLNLEQMSKTFDVVYLVDSEGNTYSGANVIENNRNEIYVNPLFFGEKRFVVRYDDTDILEAVRESLVYGVKCEPFRVNGVEFIGILGFSKISMIEERLKIDSFDKRGYTGIIDINGNYVVNRDRSAGIGKIDNYFDDLQKKAGKTDQDIKNITDRLGRNESFIEHFNFTDLGEQVVSFVPISETTWSIVLTVPEDVFNEQTQQFIAMTGIMLSVVVFALCLMMLIIIRALFASATAKAEAKARGDFLSSMSHEIRTPLNGIAGLNHLMEQNIKNPKKLEEYLKKSNLTIKYLLSLVNDILDMSKLQAGKMDIILKPFSINSQIYTIESIMHNRIEDKNINFHIETDIQIPNIIGDERRIEQILINILGNAVKFTPDYGNIDMRITQEKSGENKVVMKYEVEDTGCGMSEKFQKKIFNSFSQEHNEISSGTKGTGLGMSISFLLAKQMGGTLSVRSKLGKGSCFTFILETDIAENISETVKSADALQRNVNNDKKMKVLVAEDNELNAEILIEMLKSAGCEVFRAENGEKAVNIFKSSEVNEFDIILMDIQMPVKNGYEATKNIRALDRPDAKTVSILACTANTFKEDQDKALECGMNDFISKPIDVNNLMKKLNAMKFRGSC